MAHLAKMKYGYLLFLLLSVILSACNLSNSPEQQFALTEIPTNTSAPTRTLISSNNGLPTTLPITQVAPPTSQALVLPATSISLPPTFASFPTSTPTPISIVILSPIPGNVVAGNVQVLGAAIHPLFLQYQLEYGPDPNPGNLWYPASGISQNPVFNGLLGIWNTTLVQDSVYQLRLRVWLRDGTSLATVVNNIRVQNQAPTPIPSATPNIPRPIAAFTEDRTTGQAPLVVRFINQSSGNISNFTWSFGDGGSSAEANPVYTFRTAGVFYVTLQVNGPGGASNVTQQINVQTPSAPVAAFTQDTASGPSPLTVKFTNQSTGIITSYNWAFGDGTTSLDPNPTHQFVAVGTYNVILSLVGPGGTSFVTRKITVQDPVVPPPVAAFAPDKTTGNIPLVVQFANQSTGQITSYAWDFGDGQTSVEKNPVHTFIAAGEFTVKLTAIGPGGQNVIQTKITAVKPPDAPVAGFTQSTASGNTPLNVQFTNKSTGNITAYSWDFGDGSAVSTDKDPSHVYNAVGTFTVKLKVTGAGGTSEAQSTVTSTKPIAPPVAAFTASPTSGTAALAVQFTNQSAGESLTYSWDFGDGSPVSTDANPAHTYANAGTYAAKLTVTNSAGSNTSAPQTITVSAAAVVPVASFVMDKNSGNAPLTVIFTSTSTGDFNTLTWTFADASNNVLSTANGPATSFVFPTAGTYTATLKVDGLGGSNTSAPQTITVSAAPVAPVANFTANPASGTAPLTVAFTSTSTGDNLTYAWNFGDGSPAITDANPSHAYANVGTYAVTLTVSNTGGSNTSAPQTVTVSAAPVAPLASFTANPMSGTAPLDVTFTSTSTGDFDTLLWSFADASNNVLGTANGSTTIFTFPAAGTYTATLTVSGLGGSNASAPQTITVNAAVAPPVAGFTTDTNTGTAPLTVTFTNTSTGDNLTYSWDFGDGSPVSAEQNPVHVYNQAGTYNVTLTATNSAGTNTTTPQVITVNAAVAPPVANFTSDVTTGTAPLTVTFTNTSTGDNLTYGWDFGDGSPVSAEQNPVHQYAAVGTYNVTLTATNSAGTNTTTPQVITVNAAVAPPVANFTSDVTTGTAPLTVTFTNASTGDNLTYSWDFGDGSPVSAEQNPVHVYNQAGTYNVTLTAANGVGPNTSAPQVITVNAAVAPPVANFTPDVTTGTAPLTVTFTNTSTGDNLTYSWDFGDGSPVSAEQNPVHVYNQAGTYNVTLTASNGAGSNMSAPQVITVNAAPVIPVPPPINHPLVLVSDRSGNDEIYILSTDGTLTNVSNNPASDSSPSWSPDGNRIAFVSNRDGNDEIYVMNTDGSNVTRLTDNPASDVTPMWTASGIVFATSRDGNYEIYSMNTDGSNPVNVTNAPASNETNPAPSPDGSRIAYMSDRDGNNEIYTTASDGTVTNITNSPSSTDSSPSWENGSQRLVFVSDRESLSQIYIMGVDGSNPTRISDLSKPDTHPVWSHDGSQIAFVSQDNNLSQLYIMNPDGTSVTKISDGIGNDGSPSWKP